MGSVVNTKVLQLQSVINFMHELAYDYLPVSGVFQSDAWANRGRKEVSLRVAILLHNGHYNDNHGNPYFRYPFDDIPDGWIISAKAAKIVHVAKLQCSKRRGLIVQSHMVKFVNPENAQYFIKNKSKPIWEVEGEGESSFTDSLKSDPIWKEVVSE